MLKHNNCQLLFSRDCELMNKKKHFDYRQAVLNDLVALTDIAWVQLASERHKVNSLRFGMQGGS